MPKTGIAKCLKVRALYISMYMYALALGVRGYVCCREEVRGSKRFTLTLELLIVANCRYTWYKYMQLSKMQFEEIQILIGSRILNNKGPASGTSGNGYPCLAQSPARPLAR